VDEWVPLVTAGPVLVWLVVMPIVLTLWSSFKPTGLVGDAGFTTGNYHKVYVEGDLLGLTVRTVVFAVGSACLALLVALPITWLLERTDVMGRRLLRGFVILTLASPPLLLAISWVILFDPRIGFVNQLWTDTTGVDHALFNIYSLPGMIIVQGLSFVPTAYLILAPAFRNMDPSLEESARTSGAGLFMMIRRVLLPILRPAILSSFFLLVIVGFVVIDVPGIIGVPVRQFVLSSQIYAYLSLSAGGLPQYGAVGAMSVMFIVLLVVLGLYYQRMTRNASRFVTVTGKGFRPTRVRLGRWRWVGSAAIIAYIFVAVLLPVAALAWMSLMPYQAGFSLDRVKLLTTRNFDAVLSNPRIAEAALNSLIVAVLAAVCVAVISLGISWTVVRSRAKGRRVMDMLAFLPVAIAGTMLGSALVTMYLVVDWIPVYGTIWIIVIGFVTAYLSYGTRALNSVIAQLHPDMEDAAHIAGAGWWRTMRKITLPMIAPAVIGVCVWVATNALRDASLPLILRGRENTMITSLLWDYWIGGRATTAAAVGVLLIGVLAVLITVWQSLPRRFSND